jgi:hypothetical protein
MMERGSHDIAQICLNGHLITTSINYQSELNKEYCNICGAKTLTKCIYCDAPIKGQYWITKISFVKNEPYSYNPYPYTIPDYCEKCGKRYPWALKKKIKGIINNISSKTSKIIDWTIN